MTAPHSAATGDEDTVAEIPVLDTLRLHHIPKIPGLGEVRADAVMAAVSAGLDPRPRQRQELHIRGIEPERSSD